MRSNQLSQVAQPHALNARRVEPRLLSIFGTAFLLCLVCACGSSSPGGGGTSSGTEGTPQLTDEVIRARINDTRVWDVPPEEGTGEPIVWNFDEDEPKEITVVEKNVEGNSATVVLDIKTSSAPRRRNARSLSGRLRTDWQLRTGWVLRRWEIVNTENISMKYRNIQKPAEQPPTPPR